MRLINSTQFLMLRGSLQAPHPQPLSLFLRGKQEFSLDPTPSFKGEGKGV